MTYYVRKAKGAEPQGPFELAGVVEHIEKGWLDAGALIAKSGDTTWVPLGEVPECGIALRNAKASAEPIPSPSQQPEFDPKVAVVGGVVLIALLTGVIFWLRGNEVPTATQEDKSADAARPTFEPAPAAPTIAQQVAAAADLAAVIDVLRPHMGDVRGEEADPAGALLAVNAGDRLTWAALKAMGDSERAAIMKDPDAYRGRKLCSRGSIIEIHADRSVNPPVFSGGLMTASWDVVRFIAVHSTGSLVKDSPAHICGIVTGLQSYQNAGGGVTHAVLMTGVFDLPENW